MTIDKQALYGTYLDSVRRRQAIADKAIHKALDLPQDDDVQITNVKQSGTSPAVTAGVAVLSAALGAAAIALTSRPAVTVESPTSQPAVNTDTQYDHEFYLGEQEVGN